jgi:hypothetical protein
MFHEVLLGEKWKRASNSGAIAAQENLRDYIEKTRTRIRKTIRSTRMLERRRASDNAAQSQARAQKRSDAYEFMLRRNQMCARFCRIEPVANCYEVANCLSLTTSAE